MREKIKIGLIVAVTTVVAASLTFFLVVDDTSLQMDTKNEQTDGKERRRISDTVKDGVKTKVKSRISDKSVKKRQKPDFRSIKVMDDDSPLSQEQLALMDSIQSALDDDNRDKVLQIVRDLQQDKGWPRSVPRSIRLAAVEALQWFGTYCLTEAAGFIQDPDEEISECAHDQFTLAIEDTDISDRDRAKMMLIAAQMITDSDTMDSILFELNNMRNSVAVETIKNLWTQGNKTTQELLGDVVESVTGEEGLNTPEKLDGWLKDNPDDPGDEEFYGGSSES